MEYSITSYHMKEKNIVGSVEADRRHYDLLNVVMICLGNKKYTELNGLLRLLNMMMVDNYLTKQEKRHILTDEFDIEITPELERGVDKMCNLSEGIERRGIEKGREEGREDEKLASARRMLAVGKFSPEDISVALDLPISRIEAIRQEQLAH